MNKLQHAVVGQLSGAMDCAVTVMTLSDKTWSQTCFLCNC